MIHPIQHALRGESEKTTRNFYAMEAERNASPIKGIYILIFSTKKSMNVLMRIGIMPV